MGSSDDIELGATLKGFAEGQRVFNRYRLERILGRGGMGVVWLAFDEELERNVALKFVPELVCLDKEAIADLKRETRRSLEITHANIVRIHDFHQDGKAAAISMEYIEGKTLSELKVERKGCLGVGELKPIVKQLCEALDYAHMKAKVVHRDLKPANLMLNRDGELKITDFGISCSISDSVSRVSMARGSSGTAVFMSPQQMMGEHPKVADDIYALGGTIYDLLSGKPPFYRGNVLAQVQSADPAPMARRREELGLTGEPIPESWEVTVRACLAKDPEARPKTAGEVFERLGAQGARREEGWTPGVEGATPKNIHSTSDAQVAPAADETIQKARSSTGPRLSRIGPAWAGIAAGVLLCAGFGWMVWSKAQVERGERAAAQANGAAGAVVEASVAAAAPREAVPMNAHPAGGSATVVREMPAAQQTSPESAPSSKARAVAGDAAGGDEQRVRAVLRDFSRLMRAQMEARAQTLGVAAAEEYGELFKAAEGFDGPVAEEVFGRIKRGIGQYADSKQDPRFDRRLWGFVQETGGAVEQFATWPPDVVGIYADGILDVMPAGSVYFGGTDPGRFVITAFQAVGKKPLYVITQNALADNFYMEFLRSRYGASRSEERKGSVAGAWPAEALGVPDDKEIARCFGEYVKQSGKAMKAGERVVVEGIEGVFAVNALISKQIFDMNKGRCAFFVEESFPMDWYYAHAEPCGMLLRLSPEPLQAISREAVGRDREYWDGLSARLLANPGFQSSPAARNAFAKLRCSIANLYLWRRMMAEAEYGYRQALSLSPENSEVVFRLSEMLVSLERFDEGEEVVRSHLKKAPEDETMAKAIDSIKARRAAVSSKRALELRVRSGKATVKERRELLDLCAELKLWDDFEREVDGLIAVPGMGAADLREVASFSAQHKRLDAVYRVMRVWRGVDPTNGPLLYDMAVLAAMRGSTNEARETLADAIEIGGESLRENARKDARFAPYRALPEFSGLLGEQAAPGPGSGAPVLNRNPDTQSASGAASELSEKRPSKTKWKTRYIAVPCGPVSSDGRISVMLVDTRTGEPVDKTAYTLRKEPKVGSIARYGDLDATYVGGGSEN